MALINCPECSTEISDKAVQCIKCGYPLADLKPATPLPPVQEATRIPCPACNATVDTNTTICPHCNTVYANLNRPPALDPMWTMTIYIVVFVIVGSLLYSMFMKPMNESTDRARADIERANDQVQRAIQNLK